MSKPIFYEGQAVGCLLFGEGVIKSLGLDFIHVVINGVERTYYIDGKYYENALPTLYPIEQYMAIIPNLPAPQPEAWQPKKGEWCWFWDDVKNSSEHPVLDRFKSIENGKFKAYYPWDNCAPFKGELPEHLKEVKE